MASLEIAPDIVDATYRIARANFARTAEPPTGDTEMVARYLADVVPPPLVP